MTRYEKLKLEEIINKELYKEQVIDRRKYEGAARRIEKLLFKEMKNYSLERNENT